MTAIAEARPLAFDLVPDPGEPTEMRGGRHDLIADEDIGDSRVVLTLRAAETVAGEGDSDPVGVVTLDATFHADRGNRFVWAQVMLSLTAPPGGAFLDCQPRESFAEPVEIAVDAKGTMALGVPKVVGGSAETGKKIAFSGRHRVLKASGWGTPLAVWAFEEDPKRQGGILHPVALVCSVPGAEAVSCDVSVTARLARPGLDGHLAAFRRMILGAGRYPLTIALPPPPPTREESRFWFGLDRVFGSANRS